MPGVLPVANQRAIEYALRVAIALECDILPVSIFARKNYFYPDLPKGYQISQYEQPLAINGKMRFFTSRGERSIRIRRVHLEEDTAKLTHIEQDDETYSLVNLNRAGVPLLEIVTEPDLHSAEEVRAFATALRSLLRYLGVSSGEMQKGVIRIEPNVSVQPLGSAELGTRTEIKNLNSFHALELSIEYEIERQGDLLSQGQQVKQETMGWDDNLRVTLPQRSKEEAHDYRYFPEPDLPPLVIDTNWVEQIKENLPELPYSKMKRFQEEFGLTTYDAGVLIAESEVADYFEKTTFEKPQIPPKIVANWITGELFSLLKQDGTSIDKITISPKSLADLIRMVDTGEINQTTAKSILSEMYLSGESPAVIVSATNASQISDTTYVSEIVQRILNENQEQVNLYLDGKDPVYQWLFGQVMRATKGKANPNIVREELNKQLPIRK
jgi:aspartyl-tRNA(Asn)/glutamyl-tRNA(Gln) amidotransferase subunit B